MNRFTHFFQRIKRFPWQQAAQALHQRFRDERLGITASSLTFTTIISLVPMVTVGLAVFSALPMFDKMQSGIQKWLIESLIPDTIAKQVLTYLNQFAAKASQMGWVGAMTLFLTALSLMLTIDRKLNDIWRVRQARPLAQRILVYWAALTLGPLLVGGSISLTSYVISASKGLVAGIPGGVRLLLNLLELFMATSAITLLFKYVPHVQVKWRHAWIGGILVALGIEGAKRLLAWYVIKVPTYSAVYGTFATIPILLVWLYLLWVIVLLGAVITAYLPQLGELSRQRTLSGAGSDFELAIELIFALHQARTSTESHSLELHQLARQLRTGSAQLEPALLALQALRWIGQLNHASQTYVLLIDIQSTPIAPLCERLLLARTPSTQALWQQSGWGSLPLGHLQHQHPN